MGLFDFLKDAKNKIVRTKNIQNELTVVFAAAGRNFMQLDSVIHGALLHEAKEVGTEQTVATFIEMAVKIQAAPAELGDDTTRANVFKAIYAERGKRFAELAFERGKREAKS
jgi:hypothetical protein